ncbi:MAG: hypothetical protein JWO11_3384 [Nocardioides sp.]|nr:hypothetical protein [Nocardioides sp.]
MSRRVSLPAADDLFRPTSEDAAETAQQTAVRAVPDEPEDSGSPRRPSGRVRHDEKMTVYVTSDELLEIEHTRLMLRRAQGLAVDRGRLVREAVALVLADYEANGDESILVRRLTAE